MRSIDKKSNKDGTHSPDLSHPPAVPYTQSQPDTHTHTHTHTHVTVKDLLHGLIAHLGGGEALEGDDGRVRPVAEQQPACLQVAGQSRAVQRRLTQSVKGIHLHTHQGERGK